MIKSKHHGEFEDFDYGFAGTVSTGAKVAKLIPFACQLKNLFARVRTAGTTGTMTVDIQKNGTSIFSGATKVNFASASVTPTYGALTADPTVFAKGDILTVNITAVHTTPAVDLAMALILQRLRGTGPVGATVLDGIGPEAE